VKIVVVGNFELMLRHVEPQIQTIARHLEEDGVEVVRTTYSTSKASKFRDIARTILAPPGGAASIDAVVVHSFNHWNIISSFLAVACGGARGMPVILLYHGGTAPQFLARWGWAVAPMFRRAFEVQVASGFIGEVLDRHGVPHATVPHVLDASWLRPRHRSALAPRILWLRGFHPLYDPDTALSAFARVRRILPDATLTMIGRGPLKAAAMARAAREGIEGVTFLQDLTREALADQLDRHDLFLHTNLQDNQPLSLLEAFAAGLPAVVADVGGLRYVFDDGDAGFLVPPGDDATFAARLVQLVQDPALGSRMSARALEVARAHSWEVLRTPWMDLLKRAAAARREHPPGGQVTSRRG
jgi:glycosyltransferase involved in cell wall biosynthesis